MGRGMDLGKSVMKFSFLTLLGEGGIRYGSRDGPGQVSHEVQFFDTLGGTS